MELTLLQVLLILFPAIIMELGGRAAADGKRFAIELLLLCGVSMLLCIFFAFPMEQFYVFDMRIVPYLVGILYVGYRSGIVLTVLYLGVCYEMPGGGAAFFAFIALHLVLIPTAFLLKKKFGRSDTAGKIKLALGLNGFASLIALIGICYRDTLDPVMPPPDLSLFLTVFGLIHWVVIGFVVKLLEGAQEKRRLQNRLRELSQHSYEEAQKLRQLIDATPATVTAIDCNGAITMLNEATMAYFPERRREDFLGKPYRLLSDAFRIDYERTLIVKALRGDTYRSEIELYHERTFLVNAFPLRNRKQEITGAVSVTLEVTELLRLRKEIGKMERLSLVGQMAASITHEIRNPMAIIRGFIQLMQDRNGAANNEYYHVMLDEVDRANGIIDDFLALAQNRIIERKQIDLNDIIRQLDPLLAAEAKYRGHLVQYRLQEAIPLLLLNDKEMKQLLLNLVRNGLEAMEDRGLLTIATRSLDDAVELRVTDTGRGLSDEVKAKLFEPFFTTKTQGAGIGLAVCYSIVERHNGSITVESKQGKGTSFIVRFRKSPPLALLQT